MSRFEFDEPTAFCAGAIGEPGSRVFYIQVRQATQVVSLRLEKGQVAALAEHLAGLLADLPEPQGEVAPAHLELVEPVVAEWIVGEMGMAWDEDARRVVVLLQELLVLDPDAPEPTDSEREEMAESAGAVRVSLSVEQAAAFVTSSRDLVAAGRPPCPLCGKPLDPAGHNCPRTNGNTPH